MSSVETKEKIDGIGRTMNRVVTILEKLTDKFDNLNTRVKAIEVDHNKLTHNSYESFKITAGMLKDLLDSQEDTRQWVESTRDRAHDHKEQILKAVADVRVSSERDGEIISNNQKVLGRRITKRNDDDVSPYKWNQEYKEKCIWMLNSVEDHYPDVYKKVLESFEKRQAKNKWNLSVHNDVYDLTESNEEPSMLAKRAMDSGETNEGLPKRARAYVQTVPDKEPED